MKKTLILASFLALSPFAKGQLLLEALEGGIPFTPSEKCLERVYDKHYGDGEHNFIYCAVQGPNGKKWLNHNLGAEYAKENSPHFNPEAVPTNYNDWKAYGSLFQEGRDADGHELGEYIINSTNNAWMYKFKNGVRQTPVPIGETSNQVTRMKEWKANTSQYWAGWQGSGETDPCPIGYKVMTVADVKSYIQSPKPYNDIVGYTHTSYLINYPTYPNLYLMVPPSLSRDITSSEMITSTAVGVSGRGFTSKLWAKRDTSLSFYQGFVDGKWSNVENEHFQLVRGMPNNLDNYYFPDYTDEYMNIFYDWGLVTETANAVAVRCVEK